MLRTGSQRVCQFREISNVSILETGRFWDQLELIVSENRENNFFSRRKRFSRRWF